MNIIKLVCMAAICTTAASNAQSYWERLKTALSSGYQTAIQTTEPYVERAKVATGYTPYEPTEAERKAQREQAEEQFVKTLEAKGMLNPPETIKAKELIIKAEALAKQSAIHINELMKDAVQQVDVIIREHGILSQSGLKTLEEKIPYIKSPIRILAGEQKLKAKLIQGNKKFTISLRPAGCDQCTMYKYRLRTEIADATQDEIAEARAMAKTKTKTKVIEEE